MVLKKLRKRPKEEVVEEEEEGYEGIEEEELSEEEREQLKEEERKPITRKPSSKRAPAKPAPRFVAFSSPERVGILDSESKEVVAEGENVVLQVLADILERLERIENNIGSMMEE